MKTIITFLFLFPSIVFSQNYKLAGTIHEYKNQKVYLLGLKGDRSVMIDSVKTSNYGQFTFELDQNTPKGIYRLGLENREYLDIIFNKENIDFSTHISDVFNKLAFNKSVENKVYLSYLQKRNYDQYRMELLQPVISYYPMNDKFFPVVLSEFSSIQDSLHYFTDKLIREYPNTFASTLIKIDERPLLNPMETQAEQQEYVKKYFFEGKDFSDTALLHTNILTSNILNYLSFYQKRELTKDQMEAEFIKAVDVILPAMKKNRKIYEFVIDYLIGGFEQFGFNKVITHIASQTPVDEDCENEELKHRLETLKKLIPGNKTPEIEIGDIKLSKIKKKYTLVLFYASWCPHCNEIIPELQAFYTDFKPNVEVVSISIDTSKTEYKSYVNKVKMQWLNECDFKGWDTQAAIDYGVYVTPNMFLLDEEKKIVARPTSIIELLEFF